MTSCPTVETERLVLRPFRESDLDAFGAMLRSPEVRTSFHNHGEIPDDRVFEQMEMWLGQWELRGTGQWALESKDTGEFVGRAGSHWPLRPGWPGIELGWALHPDHWGKGYATEAGAAARDYVFAHHDVDEIYSLILEENTHSQAVARRLGFTEWELRTMTHFPELPHMIWRLTRADYQSAIS